MTVLHVEDGWLYGRTDSEEGWLPATAKMEPLPSNGQSVGPAPPTPTGFLPGSVCTFQQDVAAGNAGYLSARSGTTVTILHAEGEWLYGRTDEADGWFSATADLKLLAR